MSMISLDRLRDFRAAIVAAVLFVCLSPAHVTFARDDADLLIARTPPHTPQEQQRMFHLPPGFKIELVASEPDIVKPINMKFDSAGHLYVTQSYEYPFPHPEGAPGRDTIRRVVDTNGDGIPDKVSVFADGLSIPIGVTPIPGGVFGYSIPNLYRFPDKNADGVADSRQIAYSGFGHRDTHGMVNGLNYWLDGWIYCCHGYSNTSTVKGTDGSTITMTSGNTFRVRIDGSHVDQFSFGQVNPFGMTFDPRGDMFTADCHSRPGMLVLRGGCYQSFGRPHDGLGFAPEIMTHEHGSTGIAGIVYYTGDPFPAEYRDTIFLGNPVTGIINHDRITSQGSTHKGVELPDFMTCDDLWFRPVDLQLATDGSIYVADFYNCIIGHYEVPLTHPLRDKTRGRIWRISYVGKDGAAAAAPKMVDLSRAPLETLVASLASENLPTRTFATHELVDRIGKPAIPAARHVFETSKSAAARAHAIWVLHRLGAFDDEIVGHATGDADPLVRVHAIKAIGEIQHWKPLHWSHVSGHLDDPDPFVRRTAAEVLGLHPVMGNLTPLLATWKASDPTDTMLIHVIRIALRNTLRAVEGAWQNPREASYDVQGRLLDVCMGIHTPTAAGMALSFLAANPNVTPRVADAMAFIANTIEVSRLPELDHVAIAYRGKGLELESSVLSSLFRASRERGAPVSDDVRAWAEAVVKSLFEQRNAHSARQGIALASEARVKSAVPRLEKILKSPRSQRMHGAAAEALIRIDARAALPAIEAAVRNPEAPIKVRCEIVDTLRQTTDPASRAFLVSLLQVAPQQLATSVVDTLARSRDGAAALVEAVEKGQCSPQLLADPALRGRLHAVAGPQLEGRLSKLLEGLPKIDERINKAIAARAADFAKASPNADRGVAVFQKNCAACHQIAGKGNRVGPQLDGAGNRGVERLLEDVLDPNRNVDVNFRATILTLDDGQVLNGFIIREEGPVLVLVDTKGAEQRIAKSKIEQRTQTKLSPMPANVVDLLSPQELNDLLAYLLQQRKPGEANR
ncbi:MAG TPA: PVC-type heme-binding CxxCH protein [Planctomycetaceae bacterium]|jgi:putative heme-binding domain-containing protein|nr:PVC-type heme-binding CxxCH protein [Planctomycetaceae bacterium]